MATLAPINYHTIAIDRVKLFYREAGKADAPTVLLLHGFPSSSHMYRYLIPALADQFRVIAPDLPGFGLTTAPPRGEFDYTFDNLFSVVKRFTEALELKRFAIFVFDYGAPIGFRLAMSHPEAISAIISQNGNAYESGLLDAWAPIQAYWQNPSQENRDNLRMLLTEETTRFQYTHGVPENKLNRISPDAIAHDQAILDRDPEIQLDLFKDYQSNVALYPEWQAYFRKYQPPFLATWGENDPFFGPDGATAFANDIPKAQIQFFDTGHFALETHGQEIASVTHQFLTENILMN